MGRSEAVFSVTAATVHNFMIVREGPNTIKVIVNFLVGGKSYEGEANLSAEQACGVCDQLIEMSRDGAQAQVWVKRDGKPDAVVLESRALVFSSVLEDA